MAASAGALVPSYAADTLKPISPSNPKRGLAGSGPDDLGQKSLRSVGASWFYSWSSGIPDDIPPDIEYVPMVFKRMSVRALTELGETYRDRKVKEVLGFNEPDGGLQGNTSVEDALEIWPKIMELAPRVGSPACVHPDNAWMTAFMKGVTAKKLRVDFVTVHSYGGLDVDGFMRMLETVHKLYRRPIWITEFAVGDWKAKTRKQNVYNPEQIVKFIEQVLPRLDRCDFVERYAWFSAGQQSSALGPCALFNEDGSLTAPGKAYRSS